MFCLEPANYVTSVILLTSLLAVTYCQFSEEAPAENREQGSDNVEFPKGISRLLLKNMRFRDLSDAEENSEEGGEEHGAYTPSDYRPYRILGQERKPKANRYAPFLRLSRNGAVSSQLSKRERQQALVSNLAALLTDMKDRDGGSTLRMPSLRFG
ncbi:uncharacterized protein LOC101859684 [Aplysia californica]|uniref:Uncharacterized protein LOC101859684 n=1 Tax=Aplysia californica TaxID=6500 RepID=A0ABM0JD49_APLCA|nr:uncharacterized protein LOC101859684 [Aplysia californica]